MYLNTDWVVKPFLNAKHSMRMIMYIMSNYAIKNINKFVIFIIDLRRAFKEVLCDNSYRYLMYLKIKISNTISYLIFTLPV